MDNGKDNTSVNDLQHEQMLKIITKGFYNELIKYGIREVDIVTISTHLLDYLMKGKSEISGNEYYNKLLTVNEISDHWNNYQRISMRDVSLTPVVPEMCPQIAEWLNNPAIKYSFISLFPDTEKGLIQYFAEPHRSYFCISYHDEPVGVIGADNLDRDSRKLEMKKFVGSSDFQGKGIGKLATFLFLYYSFDILEVNKVYIYSGDTNIRNINLNSKFGFELEGLFFDEVFINSRKRDVVRMGLLRSRWNDIFSATPLRY